MYIVNIRRPIQFCFRFDFFSIICLVIQIKMCTHFGAFGFFRVIECFMASPPFF